VAAGKRPAPLGQERRELQGPLHGRPRGDDPGRRLVSDVAHGAEVDQQRIVAQAPRRPRVPARAHADRPPALGCQRDALDHVVVTLGEQHSGGEPVRAARVEDTPGPGLLVPGVAAQEQAAAEPLAVRRRHPTTAAPPSTLTVIAQWYERGKRWIDRVTGGVLIGLAARLATEH
jgi:hypothetical protein